MRKYLKTVDFINTKHIILKINPFLPPIISPTNTKLYDIEIQGQGHYPLITLYLQFYTTLTLPTIVHLQQL